MFVILIKKTKKIRFESIETFITDEAVLYDFYTFEENNFIDIILLQALEILCVPADCGQRLFLFPLSIFKRSLW